MEAAKGAAKGAEEGAHRLPPPVGPSSSASLSWRLPPPPIDPEPLEPPPKRGEYRRGKRGRRAFRTDRNAWYERATGATLEGALEEQNAQFDKVARRYRAYSARTTARIGPLRSAGARVKHECEHGPVAMGPLPACLTATREESMSGRREVAQAGVTRSGSSIIATAGTHTLCVPPLVKFFKHSGLPNPNPTRTDNPTPTSPPQVKQ